MTSGPTSAPGSQNLRTLWRRKKSVLPFASSNSMNCPALSNSAIDVVVPASIDLHIVRTECTWGWRIGRRIKS